MLLKKNIILLLLFAIHLSPLYSQILREGDAVPQSAVIYSLPQTAIRVSVTIVKESFIPGIYAQYAQKFLGQSAQTKSQNSVKIKRVSYDYSVEADPKISVAVNLGSSKNASANFLNFCSQGLIISPVAFGQSDKQTIYGSKNKSKISDIPQQEQIGQNGKKTTLVYKEEETEDGETKQVAQKITQDVSRSLEQRAKETAELIFSLREKKVAILVGDTDANYEGAALGEAMKEFDKLDKQFLELFYGTTEKSTQTMSFEVLPVADKSSQKYLLGNFSGIELALVLNSDVEIYNEPSPASIASSKGKIVYRTPVFVNGRIMLGSEVIGEIRVPIYQFGKMLFFPLETSGRWL